MSSSNSDVVSSAVKTLDWNRYLSQRDNVMGWTDVWCGSMRSDRWL